MVDTITETQHRAEFMVSQANGHRSFEKATVESGQVLKPGHVLGQVSASGEWKEWNPGNADGSETAKAVAYDHTDASGGAKAATIVRRDAEVNRAELVFFDSATSGNKDTGVSELGDQGIHAR